MRALNVQDVSALCATARRLDRRRILVITTLGRGVSDESKIDGMYAYRIPMAKTPINAIFCMRGSWSCASTGIGSSRSVTSVAIFIDALKNQTASKLRQWPGRSWFQNLATGTQFT